MPRPTARVLELLEILQSGGVRRVAELAARLGVDERTVRRYIDHLRALDIPVETRRGRHGGYRLAPGFRMPPLMLTEEEALAIVLGLLSARASGAATSGTPDAVEAALAKIRRAMPIAVATRVQALLDSTSFTSSAAAERASAEAPEAATLLSFAEAARSRHPVAFRYEDRAGRRSQRVLLPLGIVAISGRWYATGTDSLSGETRTFRLDRVVFPRVLPETFASPLDADPDALAESVRAAISATPWTHDASVLVEGTVEQVTARVPGGIATVEPSERPEWVRLRFRADRLDWVPGMLTRLESAVVVERPAELRELLATVARRLGGG